MSLKFQETWPGANLWMAVKEVEGEDFTLNAHISSNKFIRIDQKWLILAVYWYPE